MKFSNNFVFLDFVRIVIVVTIVTAVLLLSIKTTNGQPAYHDENDDEQYNHQQRSNHNNYISDKNNNKRRIATNTTNVTTCIGDDTGLRTAIATARNNTSTIPTILTVCSRIKIDPTKRNLLVQPYDIYYNLTGIDISKKNIELVCYNPFSKRCVIDGQRQSRIFYGTSTILEASDIDFINAYQIPYFMGRFVSGAALFFWKSDVALNRCSFRNNINNNGGEGSAISLSSSKLTLRANRTSPMIFSNNRARFGSSIRAAESNIAALTSNILFLNNTSEGGGTVSIYDCTLVMKGTTFANNGIGGALHIGSSTVSIENSNFYNNTSSGNTFGDTYGWIYMIFTKATFTNVTFIENIVRNSTTTFINGIGVNRSKLQLNNCTFWKNKCYSSNSNNNNKACNGIDLTIIDNRDPKLIKDNGTFVSCGTSNTTRTVFCNGVSVDRISDVRPFVNTNCPENGITRICRL